MRGNLRRQSLVVLCLPFPPAPLPSLGLSSQPIPSSSHTTISPQPPTHSPAQLTFGSLPPIPHTPAPPLQTNNTHQAIYNPPPHPSSPSYTSPQHPTPPPQQHGYIPPPPTPPPNNFQQLPHPQYPEPHHYRPPRVDLPRFNGKDVLGWLILDERYMRVHHVPPLDRVQTAALHFGNDASVWMSSYELRHPLATWDEFASDLLSRFGGGSAVNFKGALSHLQQTTSVDDFILSFTKLSCRALDWPDSELLHMFIGGLRPELQNDVYVMQPHTLEEAQRLARLFENRNSQLRLPTSFRPRPPTPYSYHRPPSSTPTPYTSP